MKGGTLKVYTAPTISDAGSLAELTLDVINKSSGTGDVIVINGTSIPVPGGSVTSVSA